MPIRLACNQPTACIVTCFVKLKEEMNKIMEEVYELRTKLRSANEKAATERAATATAMADAEVKRRFVDSAFFAACDNEPV